MLDPFGIFHVNEVVKVQWTKFECTKNGITSRGNPKLTGLDKLGFHALPTKMASNDV